MLFGPVSSESSVLLFDLLAYAGSKIRKISYRYLDLQVKKDERTTGAPGDGAQVARTL